MSTSGHLQLHMNGSMVTMVFARWCLYSPACNTCFLGPTWVQIPNYISIGSAVFAHLTTKCCCYTLQWAAPFHP